MLALVGGRFCYRRDDTPNRTMCKSGLPSDTLGRQVTGRKSFPGFWEWAKDEEEGRVRGGGRGHKMALVNLVGREVSALGRKVGLIRLPGGWPSWSIGDNAAWQREHGQ